MTDNPLTGASNVIALTADALKNGRISEDEAIVITDCADDFIRLASLQRAWHQRTGKEIDLPAGVPTPTQLEFFLNKHDYSEALKVAESIRTDMKEVFKQFEVSG